MPYADPEKRREQRRRYYVANREKLTEQARQRRAADPERRHEEYRRRRDANPELARQKSREQKRRRREANPEKVRQEGREAARRRRAADPQKNRDNWKRYRDTNRDRYLANRARQAHGASIATDFTEMRNAQNGCCYLCGDPLSHEDTNVDHDHSCCPSGKSCRYCRRGLACTRCNTLIGLAGDDPELLRRIAANLEPALKAARTRIAIRPEQMELGL